MFHWDRTRKWFIGLFLDFKYVWYTFLVIVLPSFVLVLLKSPFPFLVDWLKASRATPWGIVTSIFMHENLESHFFLNAASLLLFCFYFVMTNDSIPAESKLRRSKFFVAATFGGAIVANILFIILAPPVASSYGASGAVYASEGTVLGFALGNMIAPGKVLRELASFYKNKKNIASILLNSVVFATFTVLLFVNPSSFLSKGGNANVFAHGIAFLAGLGATFVFVNRHRQKPVHR